MSPHSHKTSTSRSQKHENKPKCSRGMKQAKPISGCLGLTRHTLCPTLIRQPPTAGPCPMWGCVDVLVCKAPTTVKGERNYQANNDDMNNYQKGLTGSFASAFMRSLRLEVSEALSSLWNCDTLRTLPMHDQISKRCSACVTTQVRNPHCARGTRVCRMELCFIFAPMPTLQCNSITIYIYTYVNIYVHHTQIHIYTHMILLVDPKHP